MDSTTDAKADGGTVRHPRRMRIEALERHALERMESAPTHRPALLAVGLSRGDRMRALLRRADTFELLAEVLDRIEGTLRPDDRYAVVSVDELWVWIAEAPTEAIARLAANAVCGAVSGFYPGRFDDGTPWSVPVGASVGGAWVDAPLKSSGDLLLAAGRAFSEARAAEDSIVIVPASDDSRHSRSRLEARVRAALAGNELELWYQPQVRMPGVSCEAVEGLIRWPNQGDGPAVSPFTLVQVCEESGLIGDLTRFNLNTALRNLSSWGAQGLELQVSLNLSARTLEDTSFPALVAQACDMWGVPPGRLLFELTESSIARNEKTSAEFMHRLRALGCELAIDDFGTGYSSFSYLRSFPVNELKIDRAFIREVTMQAADQRIVKALIEVAHAFGLRALAEGVEDADTVALLSTLGIDAIQGWHFAKAMPAAELPTWLRRFKAKARGVDETIATA
ncbi:MAG: Bacteriophytochrome cph2 [Pseudomonadota bacterium]|jgi:EAL domain-containing protein (putative c-di-GMP-specific phosphodiesterase class I)/GGDEF domain-containing protein